MDARKARDICSRHTRGNVDVLRHAVKLEEIHAGITFSFGSAV